MHSCLNVLLGVFAKARAENEARSKGRGGGASSGLLGKAMGEVRRAMSVQVVRSQSLCLLERLSQLSPGAQAAGDGRNWWCSNLRKSEGDRQKLIILHTETLAYA